MRYIRCAPGLLDGSNYLSLPPVELKIQQQDYGTLLDVFISCNKQQPWGRLLVVEKFCYFSGTISFIKSVLARAVAHLCLTTLTLFRKRNHRTELENCCLQEVEGTVFAQNATFSQRWLNQTTRAVWNCIEYQML